MTDTKTEKELIDALLRGRAEYMQSLRATMRAGREAQWDGRLLMKAELAAARKAGWVMVPKEATEAMEWAGIYCLTADPAKETAGIWSAMLAASPMGGENEA